MFQESASKSVENLADPIIRKKTSALPKHRSKALSDVKNTLHSHSSLLGEVKKSDKNNATLPRKAKNSKSHPNSKVKQEILNTRYDWNIHSDIDTHDHEKCEKHNDTTSYDLNEYKLTKNQIDNFGNRMNFFCFDMLPRVSYDVAPPEEIDLFELKKNYSSDEEALDDMSLQVPEPLFF